MKKSKQANINPPKPVVQKDGPFFPPKPARNKPAPGRLVVLITNLFKISLKQKKPIYSYGVTIDSCDGPQSGDKKSGPQVERKIPKDIRKNCVRKTIEAWVIQAKPKDYPTNNRMFSYVLDSNGSSMFALFDMFVGTESNISKDSKGKRFLEFPVQVSVPVGSGQEDRKYIVKFHDGKRLDIEQFMQFCLKSSHSNMDEISEYSRALNVILHAKISTVDRFVIMPGKSGQTTVFPFDQRKQFEISPGIICNQGYSLSVRPSEEGIVLNVANTVGPFYEPYDLITLLKNRYRVQDLSRGLLKDVIEKLLKELKNKQVEVKHIKYGNHYKKHRIESIGGSAKDKFTLVDKVNKTTKEVSIEEYFAKEYPEHKLKFPNLPCIIDRGRKLPLELCRLVDKQRVARKLDPMETAELIKRAALPPERHFKLVKENITEITQNKQAFNDFGLDIDPKPIEVNGRELVPMPLVGGSGREIMPNNGQYMTNDMFLRPASITQFVVAFIADFFVLKDNQGDRLVNETKQKFVQLYSQAAKSKGINIAKPCDQVHMILRDQDVGRMSPADIKDTLNKYVQYLNANNIDHALIVLPKNCPDFVYGYLQYLETTPQPNKKPGQKYTRTSCVKYDNFKNKILFSRDNGRMFLSNLWLKYNTKLGGVNFALKPKGTPAYLGDNYLYISVDVCHPAPGDKLPQSVAAVVGMWDLTNRNMSFCTRLRAQTKARSQKDQSTVEEVLEIDIMVSDILESYRTKKKKLPTHIIILRDGVSEGQFVMVSRYELMKIKQCLHNKYQLSKLKDPQMTCFVVQKRHKIRMMRKEPVVTRGRDNQQREDYNMQPGTVVDDKITRPNEFSFYISPHKAIQGTARAPYIYNIYDEIGFQQDEAQEMIHALSYLSPRCTKSTAIPTPVNLADLAAERGKNIVVGWNDANMKVKQNDAERMKRLNDYLSGLADPDYKNTLYYV